MVTPFFPGDAILFITGALAVQGHISVVILCLLLAVAAIAGDSLNYRIGRSGGMHMR
ncbi:MAG: hypothetical protein LUQ64_04640 [Methanomicrobiales archaeon]|nr:hypothetical protein [Methanomicrobiales archaeon]